MRYPGHLGDVDAGGVDIGEYLCELKDQEVMLIIARLICGPCRTPYEGDECPTCRVEREDPKRVTERRLREDREEKERLIADVERYLGRQEES